MFVGAGEVTTIMSKIAVIGSNMVDLITYIERMPAQGETLEAPAPFVLLNCLRKREDPREHVEIFTCDSLPEHGGDHYDRKNWIGWPEGFNWRTVEAPKEEQPWLR